MLEKLAKHHTTWIKMLVNLGCKVYDAEDLVQDMYIKLNKLIKNQSRIMYGDDINRYFVWVTLRNLYYDSLKEKRKSIFYEIYDNDEVELDEYNQTEDDAFSTLIEKINKITSKWTVYDRRLFDLYFMQGLSLRAISKGANIGLTSIHNSIINQREILREHLSEDILDYFNQDFDKI